jgi:hypothetical protein
MIEQKRGVVDLFQVCNERTDTQNGSILYKIGQGHILNMFGNMSNVGAGISFLEKSIFQGYKRAIRLLCITKLKQKFGFHKKKRELFQLSKQLKQVEYNSERSYYGVCLIMGIGIRKNLSKGEKILELSSRRSAVGKYFSHILIEQKNDSPDPLL